MATLRKSKYSTMEDLQHRISDLENQIVILHKKIDDLNFEKNIPKRIFPKIYNENDYYKESNKFLEKYLTPLANHVRDFEGNVFNPELGRISNETKKLLDTYLDKLSQTHPRDQEKLFKKFQRDLKMIIT
jgi:ATP-dependent Lon protease